MPKRSERACVSRGLGRLALLVGRRFGGAYDLEEALRGTDLALLLPALARSPSISFHTSIALVDNNIITSVRSPSISFHTSIALVDNNIITSVRPSWLAHSSHPTVRLRIHRRPLALLHLLARVSEVLLCRGPPFGVCTSEGRLPGVPASRKGGESARQKAGWKGGFGVSERGT
jgi:hypothetical protein